jgi:hypothetical protein
MTDFNYWIPGFYALERWPNSREIHDLLFSNLTRVGISGKSPLLQVVTPVPH